MVLFFGLLRPYKGVDVLLEAWRARTARRAPSCGSPGCRGWTTSFVHGPACGPRCASCRGAELAGAFRAADLVVLPYREIDQSGVLFTALAFGKPMLLTSVGGFPEIARPAPPSSCRRATPDALAARADRAAGATRRGWRGWPPPRAPRRTGPYGWDAIARADARALRGAPGVDDVVGAARRLRRGAGGARRCRGTRSAPRPARGRRCPRGSAARSASRPSSAAPQSRSSVTAREATPLPARAPRRPSSRSRRSAAPGRAPSG